MIGHLCVGKVQVEITHGLHGQLVPERQFTKHFHRTIINMSGGIVVYVVEGVIL